MDYSSLIFLLRFLPIFILCSYAAPGRVKKLVLLLGSLCFYAWGKPAFAGLVLLSAGINYFFGQVLEGYREKGAGRIWLTAAVGLNLGWLFLFGYVDLIIGAGNALLGADMEFFRLTPPLGCTVYILQAISYLTDIYRGKCRAAKSLFDFAVYFAMFPQAAAGPIVRFREVEDAISRRKTDYRRISRGVKRACIGLAKKVVIADGAGELWLTIAEMNAETMSTATAWLGILALAFCLYFYFSGYSDVAIGLADCLGFSFPENFNYPFISRSVKEFWSRWQISLGSWMKEYVSIPMGSERGGILRQAWNMAVVCGLTGLWYGADWTFLLWGLWCALFMLLENLFLEKILKALPGFVGWVYTTVVMAFGWVLFAMDQLPRAGMYFLSMFGRNGAPLADDRFFYLGREYFLILVLGILSSMPLVNILVKKLEGRRNGAAMACYRLGEKVIPGVLLIVSLVLIVSRGV